MRSLRCRTHLYVHACVLISMKYCTFAVNIRLYAQQTCRMLNATFDQPEGAASPSYVYRVAYTISFFSCPFFIALFATFISYLLLSTCMHASTPFSPCHRFQAPLPVSKSPSYLSFGFVRAFSDCVCISGTPELQLCVFSFFFFESAIYACVLYTYMQTYIKYVYISKHLLIWINLVWWASLSQATILHMNFGFVLKRSSTHIRSKLQNVIRITVSYSLER